MKYIIVLGDGMADEPCEALGGMTPLEAAHTPTMDFMATHGRSGLLSTVPAGFSPGSEIAHLSLLGYDVERVFEGRGSLEAASMGIGIEPDEMAMRCNLICINPDGRIKNHSAGHISTEEATELIKFLSERMDDGRTSFFPGISYRHLMKIKDADKRIHCTPPHDVPGTQALDVMVRAEVTDAESTADYVNSLILDSQELLQRHPINLRRISEGKDPANSIWPWSPGYKPQMTTMAEMFGIKKGFVISAVDLIRGIGVYAGLTPIIVEGATGLADTNYEGKVEAAVKALKDGADFVFLHIEASDEAGHEGDALLKKATIEYLDKRVLKPLLAATAEMDEEVAIAVLPDHPTPCHLRTHTSNPVPFMILRSDLEPDYVTAYTESEASKGGYGLLSGDQFIKEFLKNEHSCTKI